MKELLLVILTVLSGALYASESSMRNAGLETTDESGCYMTDGKSIFPTINSMVAAYGNKSVKNEIVLKIIDVAVKAGCDIHAPDAAGLSPLNQAILYNEPKLVSLLLGYGAEPDRKILSKKKYLNGLSSYEFLQLLIEEKKDRVKIKKILDSFRNNAKQA